MNNLAKLVLAFQIILMQACVSYENLSESGRLYKGMSKTALEEAVVFANQFQHPFGKSATREYYPEKYVEIIGVATNSQAFVFTGVTKPSDPPLICTDIFDCDLRVGNGRLDSWHPTLEAARKYAISKFSLASSVTGERNELARSEIKSKRPTESAKSSSTDQSKRLGSASVTRPTSVIEMWEDLKTEQNAETLFDISVRCSTLISKSFPVHSEWNIDTEAIGSWTWEMIIAKWPRSLWGSPPEPPKELVEIGAKSDMAHFDYSMHLIRIDEKNNNDTRFIEYLDLQERELKLCEQIAKNI